MATIFSKIIAGEIPSYKVAEDERFYAFLDINPLVKGHTLVVPKREVDYIFDLSDEELAAMQVFAKHVAEAIQRAFPCRKVGTGCYWSGSSSCTYSFDSDPERVGYAVSNPKLKLEPDEFAAIAQAIAQAWTEGNNKFFLHKLYITEGVSGLLPARLSFCLFLIYETAGLLLCYVCFWLFLSGIYGQNYQMKGTVIDRSTRQPLELSMYLSSGWEQVLLQMQRGILPFLSFLSPASFCIGL